MIRAVTRRTEATHKLEMLCNYIGMAHFMLAIFGKSATRVLESVFVPDHGQVFMISKPYLNPDLSINVPAITAQFPLNDEQMKLYEHSILNIAYSVYESILNSILYCSEEYAIFGTVNRQPLSADVLIEKVSELVMKAHDDFTIAEMLEESVMESIDAPSLENLVGGFNFYSFYENIVADFLIIVQQQPIKLFLLSLLEEEASLRRYMGSSLTITDNSYTSINSTNILEKFSDSVEYNGDAARKQLDSVLDDHYGIDLCQNFNSVVNGVFYEGRFKIEPDRLNLIERFLYQNE